MLILARKAGEAIVIDNEITVRVLEIKGGQIKMGVEAPARMAVHREEIFKRILEENRRAGLEAPLDLTTLSSHLTRRVGRAAPPGAVLLGAVPGQDHAEKTRKE